MSLWQVHLRRNEAHLAVDTAGFYTDGGAAFPTAKAVTIPHLGLALAVRGAGDALFEIHYRANHLPLDGIDALAHKLGLLGRAATDEFARRFDESRHEASLGQLEVVAVGHCSKRKRMAGFFTADYLNWQVREMPLDDLTAGPVVPFKLQAKRFRVPEDMVHFARAQKAKIDADGEGLAGGKLMLTSLKPRSMTTRCIHTFDEATHGTARERSRIEA